MSVISRADFNTSTPLDRSLPPASGDIQMPIIPPFTNTVLPNGVSMFLMRGSAQPVVKVDVAFDAGSLRAHLPLLAKSTADLLVMGTQGHSAAQIMDTLDFFGASIYGSATLRRAIVSLVCLQKDLPILLPLLCEVVFQPTFPSDEVELYLDQERQNFAVSQLKTKVLANRAMMPLLYQEGDRYGRCAQIEDFDAITSDRLKAFHAETYTSVGASLYVSGSLSDADIQLIADAFGTPAWQTGTPWQVPMPRFVAQPQRQYINFDSEQTSIRVACRSISKVDPDYYRFRIMDTAFGGYFGCRLMQTIRERMGLTYGIGSAISANTLFGVHSIISEVRAGSHQQVIDEIFNQMCSIASETEKVTPKELESIRGYMLGDILRSFDNLLTAADTIGNLYAEGLTASRVEEYFNSIKFASIEELTATAVKYLIPDNYSVVAVGPNLS